MPVVLVAECSDAIEPRWPELRAGLHHLAQRYPTALHTHVVLGARHGVIAHPHPSIDAWLPRRPIDVDLRSDRVALVVGRVIAASLIAVRNARRRALRATVIALVGAVGELSAELQALVDERLRPNVVAVEVAAAGEIRPPQATVYRPSAPDVPLEGLFVAMAEAMQVTDDGIVAGAPELVLPSGVEGIDRLNAASAPPG